MRSEIEPHPSLDTTSVESGSRLDNLLALAVADKIEHDPELLRVALDNIARWLERGVLSSPQWSLRWRDLLERARQEPGAFRAVLEILRSRSEEAARWRDFSPFAGVLSASERRTIIRQCSYSH